MNELDTLAFPCHRDDDATSFGIPTLLESIQSKCDALDDALRRDLSDDRANPLPTTLLDEVDRRR